MKEERERIRSFIEIVQWATSANIAYFLHGFCNPKLTRRYASELSEMARVKDRTKQLRRIANQNGQSAYTLTRKTVPTFRYSHDVALRNVLGKLFNQTGLVAVDFKTSADAALGQSYLEMDNGHMDQRQLEHKIVQHYFNGDRPVIFIMRHRDNPTLEDQRKQIIFALSETIFHSRPDKLLAAGYSEFLQHGKFYNRKGEEK